MSEDSNDQHSSDGDLSDMLQELRILLQGAQVMTAFLTILPFNEAFSNIVQSEKWVFIATYFCSITSLIFFSTPAAAHRIERPLRDREKFKRFGTRMMIVGAVFLSATLVLGTQLVVSQVIDERRGMVAAGVVAALVIVLWWIVPLLRKPHS
jgi:hypothetical protein